MPRQTWHDASRGQARRVRSELLRGPPDRGRRSPGRGRDHRTPGALLLDRTSDASHNRSVLTLAGEARRRDPGDGAGRRGGDRRDRHGAPGRRASPDRRGRRHPVRAPRRHDPRRVRRAGPRLRRPDRQPVRPARSTCTRPRRAAPTGSSWPTSGAASTRASRSRSASEGRQPDFGPARMHPSAGAVAVGARPFLIAYNINLASNDLELAKRIARRVRESGGGLPRVQAMGVAGRDGPGLRPGLDEPARLRRHAPVAGVGHGSDRGRRATASSCCESELIGLCPLAAFLAVADHAGFDPSAPVEDRCAAAAGYLRLRDFSPMQVLELRLAAAQRGRPARSAGDDPAGDRGRPHRRPLGRPPDPRRERDRDPGRRPPDGMRARTTRSSSVPERRGRRADRRDLGGPDRGGRAAGVGRTVASRPRACPSPASPGSTPPVARSRRAWSTPTPTSSSAAAARASSASASRVPATSRSWPRAAGILSTVGGDPGGLDRRPAGPRPALARGDAQPRRDHDRGEVGLRPGPGRPSCACSRRPTLLGREGPIDVLPTWLGAHAVPAEFRRRRDPAEAFTRYLLDEQLPGIVAQGRARFADVFCESGVFSPDQSRRILLAAEAFGMRPRLHADELGAVRRRRAGGRDRGPVGRPPGGAIGGRHRRAGGRGGHRATGRGDPPAGHDLVPDGRPLRARPGR